MSSTRPEVGRTDLLIFDLDGTLIDSKRDLANSVNATREFMGLARIESETVSTWVGNGAPVLMRRALGPEVSEEEVERALAHFLSYYREHMLDYTTLYPGVRESLDRLQAGRVPMAVLTNKPVRFSRTLIDGLGLGGHFFRIYGGNSFERKKPDPIGVDALLEEASVPRDHTMLVGDSAVDVRTARNAQIRCCGVTYGFQPETFEADPPDILVDRMEEVAEIVLSGRG